MAEPYPTKFLEGTQALLPERMQQEDRDALAALAEHEYEIRYGLTAAYAGSVAVLAREPHIVKYCPEDSTAERFDTIPDAENWLERSGGRAVFLLLKDDERVQRLAGYGWTGPMAAGEEADPATEFAFRIGEASKGHHLARPFGNLILAASRSMHGAHDFRAVTWRSNEPALRAMLRMDFDIYDKVKEKRLHPNGRRYKDELVYLHQA